MNKQELENEEVRQEEKKTKKKKVRKKLLVLRIPVQNRGGAGNQPEGDEYGFRLHDGAVYENAEAQPDCL